MSINDYINEIGIRAKKASYVMQNLSTEDKNEGLNRVADALNEHYEEILAANEIDVKKARERGTGEAMVDRLSLSKRRIEDMAHGIRQIVELEDPIGEELSRCTAASGLDIRKTRVPMGVIGIIYESRPNVTADAFGLCYKTGNAVILRGGSDAIESNKAITKVIRNALKECNNTEDAVILIEDTSRDVVSALLKLNKYVDLLIPRGGAGLIRKVVEESTIPVIETGTGNCHIYVDAKADIKKALPIIINAKTQRMGVCNACESLLIHEDISDGVISEIIKALGDKNIEIRAEDRIINILQSQSEVSYSLSEASIEDYATEFLGPIISVKLVEDVDEAIAHVNRYTTHHSEAIITEDVEAAEKFLNSVDAACVYVNASTRFTDGFEFGFGAEIGISTQKLHARGPMGLKELTSYKYKIYGTGQVRG